MPEEAGQAVVQEFYVDADRRVQLSRARQVDSSQSEATPAGREASTVLGSTSSTQSGVVALAAISRVGYGSTQIWDCCGILLTEH